MAINGSLSLALVGRVIWLRPKPKPLTGLLIGFLLVQVASIIYNGTDNIYPLWRSVVWLAIYHLPTNRAVLRRGAFYAALVYFPLSLAFDLPGGTNVEAFIIWTLFFLSNYRRWWFIIAALVVMVFTHSEGGLLALGVGLIIRQWGARGLWAGLLFVGGMLAAKFSGLVPGGQTAMHRVKMLQHAWAGWLQSPIVGNGPGSYNFVLSKSGWWTSHNIFGDVLFCYGLFGLVVLLLIGWQVLRLRPEMGLISAFFTHSLMDSPIYFFLPFTALFLALGGLANANNANKWYFGYSGGNYWRNIFGHRPGPPATAKTPVRLDTRPPDPPGVSIFD